MARLDLNTFINKGPLLPFPITPQQLTVPLQQHIGGPAEAIVQAGDLVEAGQKIGTVGDKLGAEIHAPISGVVVAISDKAVVIKHAPAPVRNQAEEA